MIVLTFPDKTTKEFAKGTTVESVAKKLGVRDVLAALVDGKPVDTFYCLNKNAKVRLLRWDDAEGKEVFWHSTAHLLAYAVQQLYPRAKNTIGPAIEQGFYYDFDFGNNPPTDKDLERIEQKMMDIAKQGLTFEKSTISKATVKKLFPDNAYKEEIADDYEEAGLTIYKMGNAFVDLCKGPHVPTSSVIKAVKLLSISGAYWRGDEKKAQLTRIYGVSFPKQSLLKEHLERLELAKKNDHRILGKEMGLWVFSEMVGPGLPLFTPKGAIVRNEIVRFSREVNNMLGYQEVHTPNITKADLFKTSGHYAKFKNDMLRVQSNYSNEEYFFKPMNCPHHIQIFAGEFRTYKDLPLRFSDFANLCRDEKPGELLGLTRLRCFCQDDGHAFCTKEQVREEFINVLKAEQELLRAYGMKWKVRLSCRDPDKPELYLGTQESWEEMQQLLRDMLNKCKVEFTEEYGEAAFYGPKADFIAIDSLGREWQISTVQIDPNMPKQFGIVFIDEQGNEQTPIMIHRALIGSPERFLGILLEHYGGRLPTWLAPEQVRVLPITEKVVAYAQEVVHFLKDIRASADVRNERLQKKVLEAEKARVKYVVVVGDKEKDAKTVSIRHKDGTNEVIPLHDFKARLDDEIATRA